MNALAALGEMSVDEYFDRVASAVVIKFAEREQAKVPPCPQEMAADDVLAHYTHKSYSDLNQGVASGRYPPPVTSAGNRRLWRKKDWDVWKAGQKTTKRRV